MIDRRAWRLLVGGAVAVGLGVRIGFVLARPHLVAAGDAAGYLGQANLLVEGKGWIEPFAYYFHGISQQTANLPPLYTLLMAACSVFFKSFFAHRIWSAGLSSIGVVLSAVVGREVAGAAAGVVAAFGYALYPNVWMSAGLGMSEAISPVLTLLVLWGAYRFWRRPSERRVLVLGLSIGLAALARDELALLSVLILLPLVMVSRLPAGRSGRMLAIGVLATVMVVAPWIAFNSARFSRFTLITDRFGATIAVANCDQTYHGPMAGFWSFGCQNFPTSREPEPRIDASDQGRALAYVGDHLSQFPVVELERVGRTLGFFRPGQQIGFDVSIESRPRSWAFAGLFGYYGLLAASAWGVAVVRRRKVTLLPMVGVAVEVVVVSLITYGNTRFRAPLEPVLLVLGGAGAVDLFRRIWPRTRPGPAESPGPSDPSSGPAPVAERLAGGGA